MMVKVPFGRYGADITKVPVTHQDVDVYQLFLDFHNFKNGMESEFSRLNEDFHTFKNWFETWSTTGDFNRLWQDFHTYKNATEAIGPDVETVKGQVKVLQDRVTAIAAPPVIPVLPTSFWAKLFGRKS